MKTVNQYAFETITGFGGGAETDDWEVASREELAELASAQAEQAGDDCEGDIDVYLVADQVIWIRENHDGMGARWDEAYAKLA